MSGRLTGLYTDVVIKDRSPNVLLTGLYAEIVVNDRSPNVLLTGFYIEVVVLAHDPGISIPAKRRYGPAVQVT